jgi:hypothetical protein
MKNLRIKIRKKKTLLIKSDNKILIILIYSLKSLDHFQDKNYIHLI